MVVGSEPLGPDLEPLDWDRFDYEAEYTFGSYEPVWVKVGCKHRFEALHDVTAVNGDVVATLCTDCDQQLPAGYR